MKHSIKAMTSAVLAALLLAAALTGCSDKGGTQETTGGENTTSSAETSADTQNAAETGRADAKDNLPAGINYNGYVFKIKSHVAENIVSFEGDDQGDDFSYSVYKANLAVAERLNIKFEFSKSESGDWNTFINLRSAQILAGDQAYDLLSIPVTWATKMQIDHTAQSIDVTNSPIDIDQPWWNKNVMQNTQLIRNNEYYLLTGDYFLGQNLFCYVTFFNSDLFTDCFPNEKSLYEVVREGKWTIDLMTEYSKNVYSDLNSNGSVDAEDRLGMTIYGTHQNYLGLSCGINPVSYSDDGTLQITPDGEQIYDVLYKIYDLTQNSSVPSYNNGSEWMASNSGFYSHKQLFLMYDLYSCMKTQFRNMDDEFGVLPMPKYNEEQTSYISPLEAATIFGVIPSDITDTNRVATVLEALSSEYYRNVTVSLYDNALKLKYSRDPKTAEMIDLVVSCSYLSPGLAFYLLPGNFSDLFALPHSCITTTGVTSASFLKQRQSIWEKGLASVLDALDK